ncbi:MAG: hypothetical protein RL885_14970 [Planctomycetota bacterium]
MIPFAMRIAVGLAIASCLALPAVAQKADAKLQEGAVELQSIGPIAFGPEHTLFVSDPIGAKLYAIDVQGVKSAGFEKGSTVEDLGGKLAARLGAEARDVHVVDLAVNPATHQVILAVQRGQGAGTPILMSVDPSGELSEISLKSIGHSSIELTNAPAPGEQGEGRRRSNPRLQTFTDVAYVDGQVVVAGLSNEEFASTLRTIPYPFQKASEGTGIEIYHGAHGRFETNSPVRTFVPFDIAGEPHLLAAYTCTPLVSLPVSDLVPGKRVRGTTIAELGNRNSPLDMVTYQKGENSYLLIANTSRGIMKVALSSLDRKEGLESITSRVEGGDTAGVPYETIESLQGVEQLAQLDAQHAVIVVRDDAGKFSIQVIDLP